MPLTTIDDPVIIKKACDLRQSGLLVQDISKRLYYETGTKITQISLLRMFRDKESEIQLKLDSLSYPSRTEIENLFSNLLQKENDLICIYGGEKIKRKLMIRILNAYLDKKFTYDEVRINLNPWVGENGFYQHWHYLLTNNFIEKVDDYKFKFCDRVKKWKTFGQI